MKYQKLKAELEQIITSHERQMIADGGSRLVLSPNYSINAYELLAILEEFVIGDKKMEAVNDLLKIQGLNGNWNHDEYMQGMYNGMELIICTLEDRDPVYKRLGKKKGKCKVDFTALSQERKDKVLAQIDSVRGCADAVTGVELSLERYEKLLDKEKALVILAGCVGGLVEQNGGDCNDCPACEVTCAGVDNGSYEFGTDVYCIPRIVNWAMQKVREQG